MADGSKKPIEQVRAGDEVMAGDPQNGVKKPEAVQRVIVGKGLKHMFSVLAAGVTIVATFNHPFWVPDKQTFEWAQDLQPGEHLLLADGQTPSITSISHQDETTTVYNLSISEIHTFYVGSLEVLVHNSCAPSGLGNPQIGQQVFRVWGRDVSGQGGSRPWGPYWSRVDPRTVSNYRDAAGLPDANPGRFLSIGRLRSIKGVDVTEGGAAPLGLRAGGIDEVVVPYPGLQIRLQNVIGLNPEF
jgi:hypothetical protein